LTYNRFAHSTNISLLDNFANLIACHRMKIC